MTTPDVWIEFGDFLHYRIEPMPNGNWLRIIDAGPDWGEGPAPIPRIRRLLRDKGIVLLPATMLVWSYGASACQEALVAPDEWRTEP